MASLNKPKKQLINNVEDCVNEMMEGVVAVNPFIKILKGHPRIAVRADIEEYKASNKVTVISGGGSGHEPLAAGYVGRGMLSASVSGDIFASPPPRDILAALRIGACQAGTLLVVANYTGDRLVFGIAAERARAEGIRVQTVIVGEDCALTSTDATAGRRGLCGYVVLQKIAGALAEDGRSLEDIVKITTRASQNMGTMGVSLSPCHIPGSGSTFTIADDELEVGLGVHGEAGVRKMKMLPADDVVKMMIDHMTDTSTSSHIKVKQGDRVAVMINNLGSTSILEFYIVIRAAIKYLESIGVIIERTLAGHFMTSLDMAGFQILLMHLDKDTQAALDRETNAIGWHHFNVPPHVTNAYKRLDGSHILDVECGTERKAEKDSDPTTVTSDSETSETLIRVLRSVSERLIDAKDHLNTLDTASGDGDCGSTLASGAKSILSSLDHLATLQPYRLVDNLASIVENSMGGASGGLYSLLLTGASSALKGNPDNMPSAWIKALECGIEALSKYGGAKRGDRTMLDPLYSALDVLEEENKHGRLITIDTFNTAVQAAEKMASLTKDMEAHAGRASYVNASLITQPDPGAEAVAIWLRAIHQAL